jgi:hypothetical protein
LAVSMALAMLTSAWSPDLIASTSSPKAKSHESLFI